MYSSEDTDNLTFCHSGVSTSTSTVQAAVVTLPTVDNPPSVDQICIDMPSTVQTANGEELNATIKSCVHINKPCGCAHISKQ